MKLLHTSDWHLGISLRAQNLGEDQKYFLEQIVEIAEREKVDAVAVAGDVFDRGIASVEAIALYDWVMKELCANKKIPTLVIAGNHDGAERLASCNTLLSASGLFVAGSLSREPMRVSFADADVWLIPWFNADKVRFVFGSDEAKSITDAYKIVLDDIRARFDKSKKNILVSHAFIVNAETSTSDRSAEVGTASAVSASLFEGFDYIALGHIHKPQNVGEKIRYSGTPMPYSFGKEETQEKSVTIYDSETGEQKIIPLKLKHKRTTLKGTYEELLSADFDKETIEGYVRLEVTDTAIGFALTERLKEIYLNFLEIAGKSYEAEDGKVTMTQEELKEAEQNPVELFARFCQEVTGEDASEHRLALFAEVLAEYEKEREEA